MRQRRSPLASIAVIYLVSLPLALAVTPHGGPWDTVVAGFAVGLGWIIGLAPWWLAINAVFVPALSWVITLEVSPLWGLGAVAVLMLVYGRIWQNRVPLFFSSARATQALAALIPPGPRAVLDAGCGDGRVLARLAAVRPDCRFEGVEQAPVPWLLARLRCRTLDAACSVRRGDLWRADLAAYDIVYTYLSPAVMGELWDKARREMRPGALLVSAFAIPGAAPDQTVETGDAMRTRLHVWRMRAAAQRQGGRRAA